MKKIVNLSTNLINNYNFIENLVRENSLLEKGIKSVMHKLNIKIDYSYSARSFFINEIDDYLKNIKNSEDSFLAIYLSIIFNKFLQFLISTNVRDLTSGFIIGKKSLIKESVFAQSNYGEYFIYLVVDLLKQGQQIVEIGYICKPRLYGKSKTSNNLLTLIRLGLPYIKAALKCRMTINTKNKS